MKDDIEEMEKEENPENTWHLNKKVL
jgi:hypothetical protein